MSEFWLYFNCSIAEQPQPKRHQQIDRSMIGEPTNFIDLFSGMNSVSSIPREAMGGGMATDVQMLLVDMKAG
ncbi:hypothetical protein K5549_015280 [Capra hircus]|uniref:Uncharacterized protein n=1 Tax=Capra hircus TaxID=9925 RepID=A0A452DKM0_CAPHI|nr:hypothetical protein K5549_015280 [Capra hircus]